MQMQTNMVNSKMYKYDKKEAEASEILQPMKEVKI